MGMRHFGFKGLGRVDGTFFELFDSTAVDKDRGLEGMDFPFRFEEFLC
jgi:hypothetical protein